MQGRLQRAAKREAHSMGCTNMKFTSCKENAATVNLVLKGRAISMRNMPRTHRVNLAWLYDAVHHACSTNIHITKQSSGTSRAAQSNRDGRIAMTCQELVHEEPGVYLQNAQCSMIACLYHACVLLEVSKGEGVSGLASRARTREDTPCTAIFNQHLKKKVVNHTTKCLPRPPTSSRTRLLLRVRRPMMERSWHPALKCEKRSAFAGATHG